MKNNLEKMLELDDPMALLDLAGTCGLPQEQVGQMKGLISAMMEARDAGGKPPNIRCGHMTAGSEMQQGILITFGWEGSDEVVMAYAIAFDPTCTKTVGSKPYSKEEFSQVFKKLPKN